MRDPSSAAYREWFSRDAGPELPPTLPQQIDDDESVMDTIVAQKRAIVDCIQKQHAASPDQTDVVKMHWVIQPDGHTTDVHVVHPRKVPFEPCMVALIKRLKFPAHKGAAETIDFPFKY